MENVTGKGIASENKPLTPEQIKNWRNVLLGTIGSYALLMPDVEVQALRDKFQLEALKPVSD